MRRLLRSTALALALAAAPSCDSPNRMFDPGAQLALQLHLENLDGQRVTRFEGAETIRLVLEITNTTAGRVALRFPTRRVFDFAVGDGSASILWTWSHDRIFGDTFTDVVFEAGSTETVWVEWDQRRSDGAPMGPGTFRAWGLLPAESGDLQSEAVSFRID